MKPKKVHSAIIAICAASAACAAAGFQRESRPINTLPDRVNAQGHVVRVYDVRRLLSSMHPSLDSTADQAYIAGLQTGNQNQSQGQSQGQTQGMPSRLDVEYYGYGLRNLVSGNVLNDTWKENGGSIGSINYAAGMLIIEQTPDGQRQVADFLHLLESAK